MNKSIALMLALALVSVSLISNSIEYENCPNGECFQRSNDTMPEFYWSNKVDPGAWMRYDMGADDRVKPSLTEISEQPNTSGFEREVYNSPR
jgi:hypothetical protein